MTTSHLVQAGSLEIIAFRLHAQEFCVKTTSIREIRGWATVTPLPHAPYEVLGVMNLRGTVIPIVDLAVKLGMANSEVNQRSAVVVADVNGVTVGLLVDGVSDILTIPADRLQPLPQAAGPSAAFSDGIIAQGESMICFLNLERMFGVNDADDWGMAV
ncbi:MULTISPECIES: chemotaxis protein CheW [Rhizobium/Agrobacterium group]|uniref:Chemotaxis protein n=2 Tax=Rhizobium/Agrobacterium group TaxID=227290 RepID=B9JX95_ALLAM|nr:MULTISPECIES: chemotaxis protein CheW [Rhizobium/Agrobacterium group]MCF1497016.1 purine-binding chemotaxis protein CheW [Allorhizobium sp. Av2]ACM36873.1 chemotaxis protein [Allorhizobium ampelinum S4]MBF2715824.1 purine-binding chemotaxis protein CheW [Agrobacterium vitis]MCF1434975.1 purine-binding chemotaxis protein CheW [Allorhizobium ampelinum]MCF1446360.1 purine-binding chemotaxis protein CheW [Allorhizobium ampelinum]